MEGIGSLDPRGSPHNSLIQQFFQPPWDGGHQWPPGARILRLRKEWD